MEASPPSERAISQYSTTSDKLAQRVAILSYDTNPQPWYSWLSSRLNIAANDILEVGSGTGELWRHLDSSLAKTITLTDFSSAMCDKLRELRLHASTSMTVKQCDAASLPFEDATFDLVIANHMLYHLDSPEAALLEFSRVLRPGGRLWVSLNGRDHIAELLELGQAVGRPSPILGAARITAEMAPGSLSKYFKDVATERFPGDFDVPVAEPVLGYLASWGDEAMTEKQEADARALVEKRIAEEGSFRARKNMVLFSAVKA
ncbi:MAG: hypothetical protein L6R42_008762 [Xanthoria sp. 1 TBL-2021]|nr:MAG: hypothetical protein L6R42_008762 [Xanthoria sp. 1 TBL-2021]